MYNKTLIKLKAANNIKNVNENAAITTKTDKANYQAKFHFIITAK